jgi:hypothetical protein
MSKLGYTWYPKDWNTSEAVFELTLEERGFYRELIDLAMLNDNKTEIKYSVWARKFNTDIITVENILNRLESLNLINTLEDTLFIPSCEARLIKVRAGRIGGKKSVKAKVEAKPKAKVKQTIKQSNNQIEKEIKKKVKYYRQFDHLKLKEEEFKKLNKDFTKAQIDNVLDSIENYSKNKSYKSLYLTARKWLEKQFPKVEEVKPKEILTAYEQMQQRKKLQLEQAKQGL